MNPSAWLVTGGKTFVDKVFISHLYALRAQKKRNDGSHLVSLYATQEEEAEFVVHVGDENEQYANTSGPRGAALNEALRYANQFLPYGPVQVYELIRIPVPLHD